MRAFRAGEMEDSFTVSRMIAVNRDVTAIRSYGGDCWLVARA